MQCGTIRPWALSLWEPRVFRPASSPIGGKYWMDATALCRRQQVSSGNHLDRSNKQPQEHSWGSQLRKDMARYREVRTAALRNGVSGKDRSIMAAEGYTSPISDVDRQIEREVNDTATRPIEVLQRCIQSGLASPHVLHVCFDAQYQDQDRVIRRKRADIHAKQREDQLARTALVYMLQDPGKWTSILHKNTAYVDNLCFFAVIEGLQEHVLRFLRTTPHPDNPFWRAKVFTGLIKAEDQLDTDHSANACLKLFFGELEMQETQRREYEAGRKEDQRMGMSAYLRHKLVSPAAMKLGAMLGRPVRPLDRFRTDPGIYDRFLQYYVSRQRETPGWTAEELAWSVAECQLNHPAGCNEGPALKILENYAKDGQYAFKPDASRHGSHIAQSIANFVKRTADVAESNGNMAAARWVFNSFEEDYLRAKPVSLHHVDGLLARFESSLTPAHRRLLNASVRPSAASKRLLSEKVEQVPAVQVASDSKVHANKFQNMLGPAAKEAKRPEPQKRGFGL